jgi:1-deoxy-D-xylulose-5-phosphate synthase
VFAVDRAGLVAGDGETHQGLFDAAYLSSVPGMTVMCPANFAALRDMMSVAVNDIDGPVAIRYPRGGEGAYKDGGAERIKLLREGKDITLVTHGISVNTALEAADLLEGEGIFTEVIKLGCISPIDMDVIIDSVAKTGRLLTLEECSGSGSAGENIAASLLLRNVTLKSAVMLNTGDVFAPCGSVPELRELCGIDTQSVCEAIRAQLGDPKTLLSIIRKDPSLRSG